jgi:kynureninase
VGDEVGRIIGADPETVVMHQNVSICQSLILSCFLPLPENSRRRPIVYSELNFPSVMYVYEAHARKHDLWELGRATAAVRLQPALKSTHRIPFSVKINHNSFICLIGCPGFTNGQQLLDLPYEGST